MRRLLAAAILFALPIHADAGDYLRVGSWNTANRPNNSTHEAAFSTIILEMGVPDILTIQETDAGSSVTILNLFNQHGSYDIFTTSPDGGSDRTGIVYNTDRLQLLNAVELSSGLIHTTARATFLPTFSAYAEPLAVYSVHLKSGTSNSDKAIRGAEASVLATDSLAFDNVLFAGDFNLLSSDEDAWSNIDGIDLANAPGSWRDNPDFKHLHTQNPGSPMDDRFDLMFDGDGLTDGIGIDYVPDSFTVFGNNGTHDLNGSITTGTAASPAVLQALVTASDHLPIYADFEFIPKPGDFDLDGDVDADDIDFYAGNIGEPAVDDLAPLDLDSDGTVTLADHEIFVTTLVETSNGQIGSFIGDLNLDGSVDVFGDAVVLVENLGSAGGYADGNLNADSIVDVFGDGLLLVSKLGQSNNTGSPPSVSIPEPGATIVLALIVFGQSIRRSRITETAT